MKEKLTIMIFDNAVTFGGSITSVMHLMNALDKSKFSLILVSGQSEDYLNQYFSNYIHYQFSSKQGGDSKIYKMIKTNQFFQRHKYLFKIIVLIRFIYLNFIYYIPEAIKCIKFAKKHDVDVFHFNNWISTSWIIAAKFLRVPSVGHLRGFVRTNSSILKFLASCVDHHVCVSNATVENLHQLGVTDDKITLVHDAIDLKIFNPDFDCSHLKNEFNLSPEILTYGLFGRVVPWKGVREFIYTVSEVSRKYPNSVGFIVGDWSDGDVTFFEEMKRLASELGLGKTLIFTGYRHDIVEMISMMDVIVHASIEPEPFGMGIIEGMAMEKPVVAIRSGGPLDIVEEGKTGFLVEMKNSEVLAEAVLKLLNDRSLRETMGKLGRVRVEKLFDSKLAAAKMEKVFQKVASLRCR